MSRTIKFRAWLKKHKAMELVATMNNLLEPDDYDCKYVFVGGFHSGVHDWKDVEITQFTGLLDRNGKEIYEGDKLKVEIPGYIHGDIEAEVEFNDGCFGIRVVGNPILNNAVGQFKAFNKETKGIEVIGNIYENPGELNPPPTLFFIDFGQGVCIMDGDQ